MNSQKLAPEITRQRLLVEGFYSINLSKEIVEDLLLKIPAYLELRTYGTPIIFSPTTGMGKDENSGFDAFVPLIDSGISAYFWTKQKFFSIVLYTCKYFDQERAVSFIKNYLEAKEDISIVSF